MSESTENQNILGDEGDNVISTGTGDDTVLSGAGNDTVQSGDGHDYVLGGSGQDHLIGDIAEMQSFHPTSLKIVQDYTMTMTFDFEEAGYRNTIGTYKIDPNTGEISDVQVVWENASLSGSGGQLVSGQSSHSVSVAAGEQVGFFLISNGFSNNDFSAFQDGGFRFVTDGGGAGNINANEPLQLQHVTPDGQSTTLNGSLYHATATGVDTAVNADGQDHARAYVHSDGQLQIGFEDLYGGGDRDFDDAVFTIDIGASNVASILNDHDVELQSDAGNDRLEGRTGEDNIAGHAGNDLLVGGGASTEWELVDGKWVYHADRVSTVEDPYMVVDGSDDVIVGGSGDDVLLGNSGNDSLYGGSGEDRLIGGRGEDHIFGGTGNDILHLAREDDYAEGGFGADTINGGMGDDVVYGDNGQGNMLDNGTLNPSSFADYANSVAWESVPDADTGLPSISQSVDTEAGHSYSFSIDLAANLPAGVTQGTIEVLWNGEVIDTFTTASGVFETHTFSIDGTGGPGKISLRNIGSEDETFEASGPTINTDAPIYNYAKTVEIGGQDVEVAAFAPGQAKLYQDIGGQLKVFDPEASEYTDAGAPAAVKINAIGFNVQDDLIYGISKSNGTDVLGNAVSKNDLVMMDATGEVYRIGKTPVGDYVGDFDQDGNLWTFQTSANRITKIDVDNLDANGDPVVANYYLPADFMAGRMYDIAYNADDQSFYAVEAPTTKGGSGIVHKIDVSDFDGTGTPEITSIPISGTLFDGVMYDGMAKGAYGAVFMDGEGNLYAGLNKGDHDLNGATDSQGAIYKINYDFDTGSAYAEFMSESQNTSSNDGAIDPRAVDPFAQVDESATVVVKNITLTNSDGGDDNIRGGTGNDELHGDGGNDVVFGGTGEDALFGDQGDDKLFGGMDNDSIEGGIGNDHMNGGHGDDTVSGGDGADFLKGAGGQDVLDGGDGADKLYAGDDNDMLSGGDGADTMYAGAGDDWADGGAHSDTISLGSGDDVGFGGAGADFMMGGTGNDSLDGGAGVDKIVGGEGSDTISGGAGDDHIWGGEWWRDGASDTFTYAHRGGKDTIHDFEVDQDRLDLSAYGLSYEDIQDRIIDRGWATEINLEGIDKSGAGDKIMLKSINPDDLDESNFIL